MVSDGELIWQASKNRQQASHIYRFAEWLGERHRGINFHNYRELHSFSINSPALFWQACAEYSGLRWQERPRSVYVNPTGGMLTARWFSGAKLNYCQNLLVGDSDAPAVIGYVEGRDTVEELSYRQLTRQVANCAAALRRVGVNKGDVVAGVLANVNKTVVIALATSALGAVWSSCSPDFGVDALGERLGQIAPKLIFYTPAYIYGGKLYDCRAKIQQVVKQLGGNIRLLAVDHLGEFAGYDDYEELVADEEDQELEYCPCDFADPLFILFSSGTTGRPKCIVHSVGGTLLQHKKELLIHGDLDDDDRLLFYTTCGWMMWNWQLSALAVGCAIVLYEGAPHVPQVTNLWQVADQQEVTALGLSPRYLSLCRQRRVSYPAKLSKLRTIFSTGAPLTADHYRYVYQQVKEDVHLVSISGGTDILSCFVLGNVCLPVRVAEIQVKGLGMAVEVYDQQAQSVIDQRGELVCTKPFPAMPCGFLHDDDGQRFVETYFNFFQQRQVWRHGDFMMITADGGIRIYGRSDAVLNRHGLRLGTAEIYRQLQGIKSIIDAVAIDYQDGDDSQIVLFVKLAPNVCLDEALRMMINRSIATGLGKRYQPGRIVQVADIPYTLNGKKMELAVKQTFCGQEVTNRSAMANPEALSCFEKNR